MVRRSKEEDQMPNAVIVDAVRTPVGRRNGRLSAWHPVDLAAQPLRALVQRNHLDPALIEDVIMGCTMSSVRSAPRSLHHRCHCPAVRRHS